MSDNQATNSPWQAPNSQDSTSTSSAPTSDTPERAIPHPHTDHGQPLPQGEPGFGYESATPVAPSWNYQTTTARPGIIPLQPLTIGDLFEGTFRAIRSNPALMFGLALGVMAIVGAISALTESLWLAQSWDIFSDPTAAIDDELTYWASTLAGSLTSSAVNAILSFVASTLLSGMLAIAVSQAVLGRLTTISESWAAIRPRVLSLFGVALLTSLISILPVVVGIGIAVVVFSLMTITFDSAWILFLTTVFIIVASIFPMLYLTIRLLFAPSIVALEEIGVTAAIRRSWALTRGDFWRTLGRYILITLVVSFATGILGGIASVIGGVLMVATSVQVGLAITVMVSSLLMAVVLPMIATYTTLMYLDSRIRREGLAQQLRTAAEQF